MVAVEAQFHCDADFQPVIVLSCVLISVDTTVGILYLYCLYQIFDDSEII